MAQSIAIIGAGMAGLACARGLKAAGRRVRVFDKGRSPGGRIATRRVETPLGPAQFDHGAQFLTARDARFIAALDKTAIQPWRPLEGVDWQVGAPGMSALPKAFAAGLDVSVSTRVDAITREGGAWALVGEQGQTLGVFDAIVVATPAEQAAPLLQLVAPQIAAEAATAVTAPCWTGLFAFDQPISSERMAFDLKDDAVLGWLACDSAKPGRPRGPHCWVAQAHGPWTRSHLEETPEAISPLLLEAMTQILGPLPTPILMQAHRWRFAKVEQAARTPFAWDPALRIGACGDWRLGPRVECAWASGQALSDAIIS